MTVVDSSAIVDYFEGAEPMFSAVRAVIARGQFATNVVVRYEVLSGVTDDPDYTAVRELLDAVPCRVLDVSAHERAIEIGRDLEKRGKRIGGPDTLIAGIALVHGDSVLTKNRKHFGRIDGLPLDPAST